MPPENFGTLGFTLLRRTPTSSPCADLELLCSWPFLSWFPLFGGAALFPLSRIVPSELELESDVVDSDDDESRLRLVLYSDRLRPRLCPGVFSRFLHDSQYVSVSS